MYQQPCVQLVCKIQFLFSLQMIANASFKFGQVLIK